MKRVKIYRDGKLIADCENIAAAWHWIHNNTSYSVAWAEKWEGYKLVEDNEPAPRTSTTVCGRCGRTFTGLYAYLPRHDCVKAVQS
jgi:hypothetical protein